MSAPILLTGATGNTGRVIAERLRERGQPFVALARSAARQRELEAVGIDVVLGDFDDPDSLPGALRGIERAYLVCTPDERLIPRELAFIRAAQQVGVRHLVKCSAFAADLSGPSQNLRSHGAIERELIDSGLDFTILRPHGFMQTFTLINWHMIQTAGVISLPAGDGGIPLIDVRDVAEVAVRALTEPGHAGRIYDLTGPEVLDMHQQAAILEAELGRPITYIPGAQWQLVMLMRLLGVPPTASEHAAKVFALQRAHAFEQTTSTLQELGITPTTYAQFIRDLLAGHTGGGNSFTPPQTRLTRLLDVVMPAAMRFYLRTRRPTRRISPALSADPRAPRYLEPPSPPR
jgi:uncharacterized protein YbjT (DUF2867 family)